MSSLISLELVWHNDSKFFSCFFILVLIFIILIRKYTQKIKQINISISAKVDKISINKLVVVSISNITIINQIVTPINDIPKEVLNFFHISFLSHS